MTQDLSGTKVQLDKLYVDVGRALEKINNREIQLNQQLEPQLQELRGLQVRKNTISLISLITFVH